MHQPIGPQQAQVGRDDVAGAQQDDVAGHEPGRRRRRRPTPPRRTRAVGARRLAQRLEGAFAAVLGDDVGADDREQREQDEQAVADLAERDREDAGDDEQDDERLGRPPRGPGSGARSAAAAPGRSGPTRPPVARPRRRTARRAGRPRAPRPRRPPSRACASADGSAAGAAPRPRASVESGSSPPSSPNGVRSIGDATPARSPSTPTAAAGRLDIVWEDGHETAYDTDDAALALPVRVLPGRGRACPAGSTAGRP